MDRMKENENILLQALGKLQKLQVESILWNRTFVCAVHVFLKISLDSFFSMKCVKRYRYDNFIAGFDIVVDHPHAHVLEISQMVKGE